MVEQRGGFFGAIFSVEIRRHDQENIHVSRGRLGCYVAAIKEEPRQFACFRCKPIYKSHTFRNLLSLQGRSTETGENFLQSRSVNALRQLARQIEFR